MADHWNLFGNTLANFDKDFYMCLVIVWLINPYLIQYLPAPACQGHQGDGFRKPSAFEQSSVLLAAISHSLSSCLQAQKTPRYVASPPMNSGSRTTPKIHPFSSLFPGQRNQRTAFNASKNNKSRLRNPSKTISCNAFYTRSSEKHEE